MLTLLLSSCPIREYKNMRSHVIAQRVFVVVPTNYMVDLTIPYFYKTQRRHRTPNGEPGIYHNRKSTGWIFFSNELVVGECYYSSSLTEG